MMPSQKAKRIYNEFEEVLATERKIYGPVMSEDSLPYSRAVIKEALKSFAAFLHEEDKLSEEAASDVKTAYISLGLFIDQDSADFVKAYKDAAGSATSGNREKNKQYQFIMNKVHSQEEDYLQDYKVFFSRLINDKALDGGPA